VVAIWGVEFDADRYAVEVQGSSAFVTSVLRLLRPRTSRWRRLNHRLRRWLTHEDEGRARSIMLLLPFPLAIVVQTVLGVARDG
jgi:hypothetical protein